MSATGGATDAGATWAGATPGPLTGSGSGTHVRQRPTSSFQHAGQE
jgi:hypothetical protein